ncbi:putative non-specific serine/threonine protein kinase [Helianthus debilis subsp. tardiflorus]
MQALSGQENVVQFHNAYEELDFVVTFFRLCEAGGLFDHIMLTFVVKPITFLLNFMTNIICIASFCTSFIYRLGDSTIEH